jgi:PhnB protein
VPTRLNPYLSFNGNARQAMEFYEHVFGGTLALNTFGEFGTESADESATEADKIMHGMLETDSGFILMGADLPPDTTYTSGNTITVSLSGDDAAELRGYWTELSDGGVVTVALERQMWGDEFGACVDRFGVPWTVNISQPRS